MRGYWPSHPKKEVNLSLKTTPLYNSQKSDGGKFIAFGEWSLPVSFGSVVEEHHEVRNNVGIFDVSHMGQIRLRGSQVKEFLQYLTINDVDRLKPGFGQYTAMVNQNGGIIDDLIVYQVGEQELFLCVNASRSQVDFEWLKLNASSYDVTIENESDKYCQVAIQGPNSARVLASALLMMDLSFPQDLSYMEIRNFNPGDVDFFIARTGYTGELGFEVYLANEQVEQFWECLKKSGAKPCGLGARDTLRLESCYLLYGNDASEQTTPLEVGLGWATKLDTSDFIGKSSILDQKEKGLEKKLVAFKLIDKAIPRPKMKIFSPSGVELGYVTSGSILPTLGGSGGLAILKKEFSNVGEKILVDVRGKRKLAEIVKRPLYSGRVK